MQQPMHPMYQQQQQQPMHPQMQQMVPAPKKSGAGKWIALLAVAFLLVAGIGGAAAVYFLVIAKPAPHLAQYVPKTTSVYVEIPSFQHSLIAAAQMKPVDSSRVDEKMMTQDLAIAFQRSFTLTQDDARAIVTSFDASALAVRDTNHLAQGAVLVSFSKTKPIETMLLSPRFSDPTPFVGGGVKYTLDKRPASELSPNASVAEIGLSEMTTRGHGGTSDDLVWFAKKKLLVFGDDAIVTDMASVIDGSGDSLEKNDAYKAAKHTFESGSDVAFFFDTHDLDDVHDASSKKLLDGYLKNRDPMTGAIKLVKAGMMIDMHATLTGTGVPPDDFIAPPKLTVEHKLPSDTVAYMAMSTKTKLTSAQIHAMLLKNVGDSDPAAAKELADGLASMETAVGFKFDDLIDMVGDEMALAITLDPSFKIDTSNGITDELANMGLVYVLGVKDDAKAKMILTKLRAQLETPDMMKVAKVTSLPDGFEVDPLTVASFPLPDLTVKFDGKQIIAVIASPAMTTRTVDALRTGKGSLESNPAHELALGALPKDANFYMWLDTGRITSLMLDGATHAARPTTKSALPIDALRLTGPDRVTSALAVKSTTKAGVWSLDVDSLNMPALSLFSVASELNLSSAIPRGGIFAPPP